MKVMKFVDIEVDDSPSAEALSYLLICYVDKYEFIFIYLFKNNYKILLAV